MKSGPGQPGPARVGTRLSAADLDLWRRLQPCAPPEERPRQAEERPRARRTAKKAPPSPPRSPRRPRPRVLMRPRRDAARARRREIVRAIQAVGIHRAFCEGWEGRQQCPECYRLLRVANEARGRMGLGPRPDPPWAARQAGTGPPTTNRSADRTAPKGGDPEAETAGPVDRD